MGMGRGTRCVWRWILPLWQARHPWAQVVTSLERPRHTNLDEKIRRGEPPVVSDIVKMIKNVFSELEGNNWAKIACGNISRQALSACLAESQFKGCATQQTPRFWATVLLGGHLFEIHWICRRHGGN